ncbi:hypothetical protein [Rugamonas aquatica]|uniref:Uncharacterized protein n=1 Tax=Rugamonas aquatica TaxID=2743357 RepID=A0A6A7N9K5_9BURK|nr:hypothetical protein [Rugamonas aquatica]MQA41542.1 hypothetical protein [Rugamonas aquatica]
MFAAIIVLVGTAAVGGLAASWLFRHYFRRPQRRQTGVPVMLGSWSDGHESTVAVHLRRGQR